MKVIDPAVFGVNHPSTWEVDEKHIGRSKNKLVIVKNFFTNPDDLRMYAQSVDYLSTIQGEVTNLPGYLHLISNFKKGLYSPLRYICANYFGCSDETMRHPEESRFSFQIYDVDEKVRFMSLYPHSDYTRYAAVLSLNNDDEYEGEVPNGTAFWRVKETGEEYVCGERNYRSERISNKVNSMVSFDPAKVKLKEWERYHVEEHSNNALLLYEGSLWHSPYFQKENWKTKRLTFNAFIR